MKEITAPAVRGKGFTDPWEQRKFGDFVYRESTSRLSSDEFPSVEYEDIVPELGQLNKDIRTKNTKKTGIVFDDNKVLYGKLRPYLHNWIAPKFNGVAVGDWWVLNPCDMDRYFLYTLIQTEKFDTIANLSTGSKMPRADWKLVASTNFFIPSIEEQKKIGNYFQDLDNLITLHQRKLDQQKKLKKYFLQNMFPVKGEKVPRIRFKGFSGDWELRKFGTLAYRESATRFSSDEYPFLEYEDIIPEVGRLNKDICQKEDKKKGIIFDENKVLYGKLRPYLHNWLAPEFTGVAVGDWWVLNPSDTDRNFLYVLIQTKQFDMVANLSTGSKMPRADWKLVSSTNFFVPPVEEQKYIGRYFQELDNLITFHQCKIDQLQTMKKYMLQNMFI